MPKLKKESRDSRQQKSQKSKTTFLGILLEKTVETECPADCYTVTYDRNSRLQTFQYHQSKEYTF